MSSVRLAVTNLVTTDDVVAVEVNAWLEDIDGQGYVDQYVAQGVSRRTPGDKVDVETGFKLAVGRALRQLGRGILSEGQERVREADRIKKSQDAANDRRAFKKLFGQEGLTVDPGEIFLLWYDEQPTFVDVIDIKPIAEKSFEPIPLGAVAGS